MYLIIHSFVYFGIIKLKTKNANTLSIDTITRHCLYI